MRAKLADARRVARLGYLVAIGWDAARIAADPIVAATAGDVHREVARLGLSFRGGAAAGAPLNLDAASMAYFDDEARRRRWPTEALLRKICEAVAEDRSVAALLDGATVS